MGRDPRGRSVTRKKKGRDTTEGRDAASKKQEKTLGTWEQRVQRQETEK